MLGMKTSLSVRIDSFNFVKLCFLNGFLTYPIIVSTVLLGKCLKAAGVVLANDGDQEGLRRFIPIQPIAAMNLYDTAPLESWVWRQFFYKPKQVSQPFATFEVQESPKINSNQTSYSSYISSQTGFSLLLWSMYSIPLYQRSIFLRLGVSPVSSTAFWFRRIARIAPEAGSSGNEHKVQHNGSACRFDWTSREKTDKK